ncbi:hypothetical protein [Paenibacillus polymyxa]|uniref:hypothetical protein n=1 Tax=Paenibacillus polymyxa TaxID=1406 RepID=UPI0018668C0C|nr:hypothetical protein [Paenibacillus polymyxa]MBE3649178.1 hypothetical protein [Paenibacillus polymyxa]
MNHKERFTEAVTALIDANIADRTERMDAVDRLTTTYISETGETPGVLELERLTDYILREEITDPNPYKMSQTEYPFMSERQFELRRDREASGSAAEATGTDGKDYSRPTRRKRTEYENWRVDTGAKIRNKERAEQYRRDTAPGPVVTYNLRDTGGELTEEFTQCVGILNRLPEREQFVDADVQIAA